jgi:hypothetical protein
MRTSTPKCEFCGQTLMNDAAVEQLKRKRKAMETSLARRIKAEVREEERVRLRGQLETVRSEEARKRGETERELEHAKHALEAEQAGREKERALQLERARREVAKTHTNQVREFERSLGDL